jgi:hypothetical protein
MTAPRGLRLSTQSALLGPCTTNQGEANAFIVPGAISGSAVPPSEDYRCAFSSAIRGCVRQPSAATRQSVRSQERHCLYCCSCSSMPTAMASATECGLGNSTASVPARD